MKKNLFDTARLKLTAFYLAIIMVISLTFSLVIYQGVGLVFYQRMHMIEKRMRKMGPSQEISLVDDIRMVKQRVLVILGYANAGILVFSGAAGYWLAGQTLKPIQKSMEDQKRFVADAAHELRTPLTALKTSLEVALRNKNKIDAKQVLKSNLEEVNSLQKLTNNLLNLAKYQDNGSRLNLTRVNLKKIIDQAYKKIKPMAEEKNIKIKFDLAEIPARVDEQSIQEMLVIFLDNAVKYTSEKGRVKVNLYSKNKQAIIRISDTGIGIAENDLPHIFDRFYQADVSRTRNGYGLGLSLAKKIVDLHQGKIKVKSELGKGTTFTIRLPQNLS